MRGALRNAFACCVLASLIVAPSALAQTDLAGVRTQLTADIQAAQRELSEVQAMVSRERSSLAQRLNTTLNSVLELREQAVAARRLVDEQTLTLNQLELRLEAWQEQSLYQSRLLAGYLDRSGARPLTDVREVDMSADLRFLAEVLSAQNQRLYPSWQSGRLVLPDGQVGEAEMLSLGPVSWFRQSEAMVGLVRAAEQAAVASTDATARAVIEFDGAAGAGLEDLYQRGDGSVTFDPTLTRALLLAENQQSLWQHLRAGGIWVVPILFFALVACVAAILKAVYVYRLPPLMPMLAERTQAAFADDTALQALTGEVTGMQGELLRVALAQHAPQQREDRLYAALLEQRNRLQRWLGAIAITATVSPLFGLLGTVSGMITTFRLMTLFGAGDANAVSAGISEALVTTELGLVVAIPALLAHALIMRKVKSYFSALENDAVQLSQLPKRSAA